MSGSGPARLIVFSGPACSGKSTLAERLSAERGIPHFAMDDVRERLLPDAPHTRADRAVAYRGMHWASELLLDCGASVILDAPYGHREDRRAVEQVAANSGAPVYLVECRLSPAEAVRRFSLRDRGPRLDLTEQRVEELARMYPYSGLGLQLETGRLAEEECLARIREYLAAGGGIDPAQWAATGD